LPDLKKFKDSIAHHAPRTRATKLAPIFKFLEINGHTVPKSIKEGLLPKNKEPISEEKVPDVDEIRLIMEHLTLPDKALVYFLVASGMRIGEALLVKIDMIDFDHQPTIIDLPASIVKGVKKRRFTFLTEEATDVLKTWLENRTEYGIKASKIHKGYTFDPILDKRVFPFAMSTFNYKWKLACEKAGLAKEDPVTGRRLLTPHKLRKFFRTRGNWINPDVPEALMGRSSKFKATYDEMMEKKDIIVEEYLRVETNLSIN